MAGPAFANLVAHNIRVTSPRANRYNCIAWAAGCKTKWWWPEQKGFWPSDVPRERTIAAFEAAFESLGYRKCKDEVLEEGFEKIALYADNVGGALVPTHAARQLGDGWWTSKLGPLEDIAHIRVEDVNALYGRPVLFMRRPFQT